MNDKNNLRMMLREALDNMWSRIRSMFGGLDDRVTALEQGGGGGGGDVNVIEAVSFNGVNVPPDANKRVSMTESDPTVPAWAKAATKPTYTAYDVGAVPNPLRLSDVDLNEPDNGITGQSNAFIDAVDKNGSRIGTVQFSAYKDGSTFFSVYAGNKRNGANFSYGVRIIHKKDGTGSYQVSEPGNFRAAISAQEDVGFYVDAQGYLCQRIRSDT